MRLWGDRVAGAPFSKKDATQFQTHTPQRGKAYLPWSYSGVESTRGVKSISVILRVVCHRSKGPNVGDKI
jgi:hypothetical protein